MSLEGIFSALTAAVGGAPVIALGASFVWGILSIALSPCHLACIPMIVGFIDEQGAITTCRAFVISLAFAAGILITIGLIGTITAAAGRMMGDIGPWGTYLVAVIFIIVGLHLLGVIPLPWCGPEQPGMQRKGVLAAFVLGLVFGVALGPCTFAYMAPMLAVVLNLSATQLWYGVLLMLMYGFGHCAVIVFAGTFSELIQRFLNWNERSQGALIVRKMCGVLVIVGGVYLLFNH